MGGIQAEQQVSILDPYALTTVHNARVQLGIPGTKLTPDLILRLERLINAASASIESFTDRFFKARDLSEIYDGRGTSNFVPAHWPINSISELWIDSSSEFTDTSNLIPSNQYRIMDKGTSIELLSRQFSGSRASVKINYNCGYEKIPYDVSYACDLYVEWFFRFNEREDIGRTTRSKGDESVNLDQSIPMAVVDLVKKYKRMEFGGASPRSSINI